MQADDSSWEVIGGMPIQKRKAGIVLVERKGSQWHLLAPWAEGPCGDGLKTYGVAKGSNEKNETPWEAALREVKEETHIDLLELYKDLKRPQGQKKYPGSRLQLHDSQTFPPLKSFHSFINPTHKRLPCWVDLYVFEVEGLDNLHKHTKGAKHDNSERLPKELTAEHLNNQRPANERIPDFKTLLNIMRTGRLPPELQVNPKTGERTLTIFYEPILPAFEELYEKRHKEAWDKRNWFDYSYVKPAKVMTPKQLHSLCAKFYGEEIFNSLLSQTSKVRDYLEKIGRLNDDCGIKLDDKQNMLMPLQEGSDVLPFNVYLRRLHDMAKISPMYRAVMFDRSCRDLRNNTAVHEGESLADSMVYIHDRLNELTRGREARSRVHTNGKKGVVFDSAREKISTTAGSDYADVPKALRDELNRTSRAASGYNLSMSA